ncbi:hypothetical protein L9F63_019648, partial [Diploptera punctata]
SHERTYHAYICLHFVCQTLKMQPLFFLILFLFRDVSYQCQFIVILISAVSSL